MVATMEFDGGAWALLWALLVVAAISFSSGVALSPVAIFVARTLNIVDKPNGRLKRHAEPVAYLGGLALCLASVLALAFIGQNPVDLLGKGVAAGALALLVLGTIDDKLGLSARFKLLIQLLICPLVAYTLIGDVTATGWFWVVAASAWLVLMTNAFNILDVANGLAASVAAMAAAFIALLGFYAGNVAVALAGTALVGAALAFLLFNFPRARMFLGDGGSLFLGFMLGVLCIKLGVGTKRLEDWAAASLVLAVPVLDVLLVSLCRWRRGIPIMQGSRDHLAHRLGAVGLTCVQLVLVAVAGTGLLGILAVLVFGQSQGYTWICAGSLVVLIVFLGDRLARLPRPHS